MTEVSTTLLMKNGRTRVITVSLEDGFATWLLTQPEEIKHEYIMFEFGLVCSDRRYYRYVQSLELSVDHGHDFEDESSNIEANSERDEKKRMLDAALTQLTEQQRWLFNEIYHKERKQVELAKELGITAQSLSERIERMENRIKKFLKNF